MDTINWLSEEDKRGLFEQQEDEMRRDANKQLLQEERDREMAVRVRALANYKYITYYEGRQYVDSNLQPKRNLFPVCKRI